MKLGLGLYRHMLTRENFQFARQAGATHLVVHLVDYFKRTDQGVKKERSALETASPASANDSDNQPVGTDRGWGRAGDPDRLWTVEELIGLRKKIEAEGLTLEAIENFDPAHWHDVLLDGPKKQAQLE